MRTPGLVVAACLMTAPLAAQTTPRVSIAIGAAAQPGTTSFDSIATFPYFAETARLEGVYDVDNGIAVDVGGQVRVWRSLSGGVAVTRLTRNTESETRGSYPHPFFFNTNRTGTWPSGSLDRTEIGVHLSAAWEMVQRPRFMVSVFGGPSFFNYEQAVVNEVDVIQSYPYDSIDAHLVTGTLDGTVVGFHAGGDVSWFFSRYVGVGGLIRFTSATDDVHIAGGQPFNLELGGLQGGVGIRLRF